MKDPLTQLPASASNVWINIAGGIFFSLILIVGAAMDVDEGLLAFTALGLAFLIIASAEILFLRVHRRPSAGISATPQPWNFDRIILKELAFVFLMMCAWLTYNILPLDLFPELEKVRNAFNSIIKYMIVAGVIYTALIDRYLKEPNDSLYCLGVFLTLRWKELDSKKLEEFLKSVLLRYYFIPFSLYAIFSNIDLLRDPISHAEGMEAVQNEFVRKTIVVLLTAYSFFSLTDVLYGTLGYLSVFRPLDTHIRSTDKTGMGWISCLICYPPFFNLLGPAFLLGTLFSNPEWYVWFADQPVLLVTWGTIAVACMFAESFSPVIFGLRFSNLTYRGLMTGGLYRYTKHPQYIAKMLNRFFVYMPFISLWGWPGVMTGMLGFCVMIVIYYFRARTEENHLCAYPEYVAYAQFINEHGVFRFVTVIFPFLRFDVEKAKAGRWF